MNKLNILGLMVLMLGLAACGGAPTNSGVPSMDPNEQYAISGVVSEVAPDGASHPVINVTVTCGDRSDGTEINGIYSVLVDIGHTYTCTPSDAAGDTFTPTSRSVTVTESSGPISHIDFSMPAPVLTSGKLLYPCTNAVCKQDLSSGAVTKEWSSGTSNQQPNLLVPYRNASDFAFIGTNIPGILSSSAVTGGQATLTAGSTITGINCSVPDGMTEGQFDITPNGQYVVFSSQCHTQSGTTTAYTEDVVLMRTDGSGAYVKVADSGTLGTPTYVTLPPTIESVDAANNRLTVLYVAFDSSVSQFNIMQQVVDLTSMSLSGAPTVFESNVTIGGMERWMSVDENYTHVAFTKVIYGVVNIIVKSIADGTETDIGPGYDPAYARDGSGLLLFSTYSKPDQTTGTATGTLWAAKADGTTYAVPTPSDLTPNKYGTTAAVVFAPAGS